MWRPLNKSIVVSEESSDLVRDGRSDSNLGEDNVDDNPNLSLGIGLGENARSGTVTNKKGFGGTSAALFSSPSLSVKRRKKASKPRRRRRASAKSSVKRVKRKKSSVGGRKKKGGRGRRRTVAKKRVVRRRRSKAKLLPGAIF